MFIYWRYASLESRTLYYVDTCLLCSLVRYCFIDEELVGMRCFYSALKIEWWVIWFNSPLSWTRGVDISMLYEDGLPLCVELEHVSNLVENWGHSGWFTNSWKVIISVYTGFYERALRTLIDRTYFRVYVVERSIHVVSERISENYCLI